MPSNSPTRSDLPEPPVLGPTERICPACGVVLRTDSTRRGGRCRDYCSDQCRVLFNQYLRGLYALTELQAKATHTGWLSLRQRAWMALNSRAWNRGLHKKAASSVATAAALAPSEDPA